MLLSEQHIPLLGVSLRHAYLPLQGLPTAQRILQRGYRFLVLGLDMSQQLNLVGADEVTVVALLIEHHATYAPVFIEASRVFVRLAAHAAHVQVKLVKVSVNVPHVHSVVIGVGRLIVAFVALDLGLATVFLVSEHVVAVHVTLVADSAGVGFWQASLVLAFLVEPEAGLAVGPVVAMLAVERGRLVAVVAQMPPQGLNTPVPLVAALALVLEGGLALGAAEIPGPGYQLREFVALWAVGLLEAGIYNEIFIVKFSQQYVEFFEVMWNFIRLYSCWRKHLSIKSEELTVTTEGERFLVNIMISRTTKRGTY